MKIATPWLTGLIKDNPSTMKAWYGRPGSSDPNQSEFKGGIWPGEPLEILAITAGEKDEAGNIIRGSRWVQFIRRDGEGNPATLWMPFEVNGYGFMPGNMALMSISLNAPDLYLPGDVDVAVCIFDGVLHSEPDGSADVVKYVYNGDLLNITEFVPGSDMMVAVRYQDTASVERTGYFDNWAPCPIQIRSDVYYPALLKCGFDWMDVPVYQEPGPEPEPEPQPTGCSGKIGAILQSILDWLKKSQAVK